MPPFAPVDQKIPVRRENLAVVIQLRHAHEARIGQAHRLVGIFFQQLQNVRAIFFQHKIQPDDSRFKKMND